MNQFIHSLMNHREMIKGGRRRRDREYCRKRDSNREKGKTGERGMGGGGNER